MSQIMYLDHHDLFIVIQRIAEFSILRKLLNLFRGIRGTIQQVGVSLLHVLIHRLQI